MSNGPPDADPRSARALPPDQQERRDRIARAALQLLEAGEYEQIQMRDVATRADVALGTLYRYFASKEHLYAAVMLAWFGSFRRRLERDPLPDGARDALREFARRAVAAFVRKPQFLRVEFVLEGSTDPDASRVFDEFSERYGAAFRAILAGYTPADVRRIERVMGCVLGTMLRRHAMGRAGVDEVYDVVLGTVDLIFSPAPRRTARTTRRRVLARP